MTPAYCLSIRAGKLARNIACRLQLRFGNFSLTTDPVLKVICTITHISSISTISKASMGHQLDSMFVIFKMKCIKVLPAGRTLACGRNVTLFVTNMAEDVSVCLSCLSRSLVAIVHSLHNVINCKNKTIIRKRGTSRTFRESAREVRTYNSRFRKFEVTAARSKTNRASETKFRTFESGNVDGQLRGSVDNPK